LSFENFEIIILKQTSSHVSGNRGASDKPSGADPDLQLGGAHLMGYGVQYRTWSGDLLKLTFSYFNA